MTSAVRENQIQNQIQMPKELQEKCILERLAKGVISGMISDIRERCDMEWSGRFWKNRESHEKVSDVKKSWRLKELEEVM